MPDRIEQCVARRGAIILVVGKPEEWSALTRREPPDEEPRFVGIRELTVARLDQLRPSIVITPLVRDGFDAVDVVYRLASAEFQGRFRIVALSVPKPDAVRAELQAAADEIDFDLLGLRPQ